MEQHPNEIRTDVAVVGGGLAGLTAARLLQTAGVATMVIEPHGVGGRGRTDERNGFLFNRGPHALYLGGPAHQVLDRLGVHCAGGPPGTDTRALRGDIISALPAGAASLARTSLMGVRGKVAFARLLTRLPKLRADALAGMSFADWLDEHDLPDDARDVVEAVARVATYVNAPHRVSADLIIGQLQMAAANGVRYVHGGWQAIADSLAATVEVHRMTATAVHCDGADVVVETAEGPRVIAAAAVTAVGTPAAAASLLGRAPYDVGPAVEAACLDLGTDIAPAHSLLLGIDHPLYLSNHCPPARLAPDGRYMVHVARYLAPGDDAPPAPQRAELAAHAARVGLTDDHIVEARYLHRMTVVGALTTVDRGGLAGRPSVTDTGVPGVFLAGDWVGPEGHLLDASVASAEAAAHAALTTARLVTR